MNMRQLRTVAAFLEQQSFAATSDRVGLSPSAISIQMLRLEAELGIAVFDRSTRPPTLTTQGVEIARVAREILELEERIRRIARGQTIAQGITIGFVPTTLTRILPRVVGRLREAYPELQINIKSGLSGELAAAVMRREMDFALITAPPGPIENVSVHEIAREPLVAIGPLSLRHIGSDAELLAALPFISFNKRAWLGQKIAAELQSRAIPLREGMDVDSLDTIEELVAEGFGVSVVPQRLLSQPLGDRLQCLPFGAPAQSRRLSLIEHVNHRSTVLEASVRAIFQAIAEEASGSEPIRP
ncbi:LysR substrate-binding domain-containing protein [Aureimonas ureilytica]|uniref:LysR substrate-binding domain-containing protein n=1 Tax=Aureimonas ureilytica TaxID=401562 RepID=UPI000368F877|nr:LysR substrate-binding domain-containing protein [Aureimonas ureilytica]